MMMVHRVWATVVVLICVCVSLTTADVWVSTQDVGRGSSGKKVMIGYFFGLYKYDPHGGRQPLPPNVTSAVELLEEEMGPILPNYDVVIQAFINPSSYNGTAIVDTKDIQQWREGVNGKPGLKELCKRHGIPLMVSMGGGGAARFVRDDPNLVDALYQYAVEYGYDGIDIDEENTVPTDVYVDFLTSLGTKLRSHPQKPLNVSCTIGPLSCCVQSRGICKAAPHIDWAFMMLYDGLAEGGGWTTPAGSHQVLWQSAQGQEYCGITPVGPERHGIVSDVGAGACEFLNFALHMNWPAEKLVFGMPLYSLSPVIPWYEAMEQNFTAGTSDASLLMTPYVGGTSTSSQGAATAYLVSPSDVTTRIKYSLSPKTSRLGVTLDNSGWESKLVTCGTFNNNSTYVGADIKGIGFWQMSFEDNMHHEVSSAARAAIAAIDE